MKYDEDRINLIYADTPFDFDENFEAISKYTDQLPSLVWKLPKKNLF